MNRAKVINREIDQIMKKVSDNRGGLVASLRHFVRGGEITGDAIPPRAHHSYLIEAGILGGDSYKPENHKGVCISPWRLSAPGELIRSGDSTYTHSSDLIIPVERKLSKIVQPFGNLHDLRPLDVRDLEGIADGEVSMSLREIGLLISSRWTGWVREDLSPLEEFNIFIGNGEVGSYFGKFEEWENWEKYIRDSVSSQAEIDKDYAAKTRFAAKNLVMVASEVNEQNEAIKVVEPDVLRVSGDYWKEQDGEDFRWSDPNVVSDYLEHRGALRNSLHRLEGILPLEFPDWIDTSPAGVPGQIGREKYLSWINRELVPDATGRMSRIDSHLRSEEVSAQSRAYGPSS